MKLIDILVEELPKCGGWDAKWHQCAQDGNGEVCFFTSGEIHFRGIFDAWSIPPGSVSRHDGKARLEALLADDYSETIITREQYEAALAAKNDGWIDWGGGECPVPEGALVDVRYRDSKKFPDKMRTVAAIFCGFGATKKHWTHHGLPNDIIAYRLHKPKEVTEADGEADLNECIGHDVATAWNGERKPTIGTKCEHHSGGQWEVVTIAGIYENFVTGFTDYWMVKEDGSSYTVGNPYRFRPIRSEADRKREEAVKAITLTGWCQAAAEEIYDLIAAGKVPGMKLED